MNCFEGAKTDDSVAAVGVCLECGVGLCLDHLVDTGAYLLGGTAIGCGHELPRMKPLHGVVEGIEAAARHQTAGIA